ncbi:MAG TPA: transcription antitermination factor NusB [Treponema sp.]|nr:transcription antitermination factor NusB [Treponema sp.]HBB42518.1 transcription antitermination factor NusB [Treponema sp.]HCA20656.1 transcription antitermination factor NusB [Treponema sp.]
MSRRKGRILAFQALYSYDVGGVPLDELLKLEWAEAAETEPGESTDFARMIIAGTINHLEQVDESIRNHLSGSWTFDRINKVTLAILRMSIYSLIFQPDIHPTIVIDEAIDIAKEFGSDDSFKFINAVLDTIRKELDVKKDD